MEAKTKVIIGIVVVIIIAIIIGGLYLSGVFESEPEVTLAPNNFIFDVRGVTGTGSFSLKVDDRVLLDTTKLTTDVQNHSFMVKPEEKIVSIYFDDVEDDVVLSKLEVNGIDIIPNLIQDSLTVDQFGKVKNDKKLFWRGTYRFEINPVTTVTPVTVV